MAFFGIFRRVSAPGPAHLSFPAPCLSDDDATDACEGSGDARSVYTAGAALGRHMCTRHTADAAIIFPTTQMVDFFFALDRSALDMMMHLMLFAFF